MWIGEWLKFSTRDTEVEEQDEEREEIDKINHGPAKNRGLRVIRKQPHASPYIHEDLEVLSETLQMEPHPALYFARLHESLQRSFDKL